MSTLEGLFGRAHDFTRPPRAYLKGQVGLIARELGVPRDEAFELFDASYRPNVPEPEESNSRILGMAVACGLGGVSILAIVLAFVA